MTEQQILELETGRPRDWLLVSEAFQSHQGEGPSAGERAFFIRLGGCNLTCRWCDTPYTWVYTERQVELHNARTKYDPKTELTRQPIGAMVENVLDSNCSLIVLTGGEPLLQVDQLSMMIRGVNAYHDPRRFEVETAGTLTAIDLVEFENVSFNVSLKLHSSGNETDRRRVPDAITFYQELADKKRAIFKFVINAVDTDLNEIELLIRQFELPRERIWLMPQGTTHLSQVAGAQQLMPIALDRGFNFTSRLHVLGYGNERGI